MTAWLEKAYVLMNDLAFITRKVFAIFARSIVLSMIYDPNFTDR